MKTSSLALGSCQHSVYKYSQWPIWPSLFHPPSVSIPFLLFFLRFVLFPRRGKEVGRLFSRWISRFQIPRECDTIKVEVASSLRLTRHLHLRSSAVNSVPRSIFFFFFFLLFLEESWKNSCSFISFLIIIWTIYFFKKDRYLLLFNRARVLRVF